MMSANESDVEVNIIISTLKVRLWTWLTSVTMCEFCLWSWWKEGIYMKTEKEVCEDMSNSAWLKFAEEAETLKKTRPSYKTPDQYASKPVKVI